MSLFTGWQPEDVIEGGLYNRQKDTVFAPPGNCAD